MRPARWRFISGNTAREHTKAVVSSDRRIDAHSSAVMSSVARIAATPPALLTSTSTRLQRSTTAIDHGADLRGRGCIGTEGDDVGPAFAQPLHRSVHA